MTTPLPTPDDLIALLSESVTWHTPTPEGPRATISPQWVERMAEAISARLRPAFEQMRPVCSAHGSVKFDDRKIECVVCPVVEHWDMRFCELADENEKLDMERDALRTSLASKDEALRACGEALEKLCRPDGHYFECPAPDDATHATMPHSPSVQHCLTIRAALARAQEPEA